MSRLSARSTRPSAFAHYLRTGRRLPPQEPAAPEIEFKFNPYHDPETGRFTFAPGGGQAGGGQAGGGPSGWGMAGARGQRGGIRPTRSDPRQRGEDRQPGEPARPDVSTQARSLRALRGGPIGSAGERPATERLGILAMEEESRGNAATVSSGRGDRGGRSYGPYQLATNGGIAGAFVASPEFGRWAGEFRGLTPGTPAFDARWRAIASRDPQAIEQAQYDYLRRTNYAPAVRRVRTATGTDLDGESRAVREAVWSVTVQHGGAATILADAVRRTNERLLHSNADRDETLINSIYDARADYVTRLRDRAKRAADLPKNKTKRRRLMRIVAGFNNTLMNRYPRERAAALALLRAERTSANPVEGRP